MKPTYEEFKELVKEYLIKFMPSVTEVEIEKYINTDDSQEVIREEYDDCSLKFAKGEITERVFRIGGASAAAYCLDCLY